ncbi:GNAT family N-acetyltransferase [Cerasicoccus arenae]|uniref:N-acetyltransferase n=1 Tax=Cerasicoccus arenae TaxID=424488 RepID=A0A8J3DIM0_9BACT|nr:GNAT family N-acetyltransferase [Cerasicoccus arenae]MBK1859693.1 GNAT family N-acetyltransferase [Cerasicoccus arenae]GHC03771.1 N-acetyltransferase [Cerasicoccus arenae]
MIRAYRQGDHIPIAEIFPRAIHEIASSVYSLEQCEAWSEKEPNPNHWKQRCEKKKPYVFVEDGTVAGFCELDPDGHIDCTYVHPDHKRKGIASQLVSHVANVAKVNGLKRVYVEASICAKPMFEKLGFTTIKEQTVAIRGVGLKNFKMEKECK